MNVFNSYNRKVAAQLQAAATVAARRQDEADVLAVKQLSDIRRTLPVSSELPPELQRALPPREAVARAGRSVKWIFGALGVVLVGGYLWSRR